MTGPVARGDGEGERRGESGTLFVVATPIGNLGDITLRAIETLKGVPVVAAEDTRRTRALLQHLGIAGKKVMSFHAHSSDGSAERLVELLVSGEDIAVVTDAGTPLVSDPGSQLVARAIAAGVRVVPLPGPSAALAALVVSGLASDAGFRFFAFLPREGKGRREALARIADTAETAVFFESPARTAETLAELALAMPERAVAVVREVTKVHEEVLRGTLAELAADPREYRGEITIVLGPHARREEDVPDDEATDRRIREELARGGHAKAVADRVAAWSGRPRRDVYARVVAIKDEGREDRRR